MFEPLGYENIEDKRVVILQSGGLDSNIIASVFNFYGFEMHHIFVNYGQNMLEKEREYAEKIAKHYGGTFSEVTLNLPWLKETTKLVDNLVDDIGDTSSTFNTNSTGAYVPMRNHVLLSIASSYAEAYKIPYIACAFDGAEDENHIPTGGTTDKHPTFVTKLSDSINEGSAFYHIDKKHFTILTPVMGLYKPEIIGLGLATDSDMSISWSCYNKAEKPCGKCSACELRAEAFKEVGIPDPSLVTIGLDLSNDTDKTSYYTPVAKWED